MKRLASMQKSKYPLFAACAYLALVGPLVVTMSRSGQAQSVPPAGASNKDVRVINTPAEAVPVSVVSLPAVQVSSLPAVLVGNGPGNPVPVRVSDLPEVLIVRDADHPARQPFGFHDILVLENDDLVDQATFIVPEGKRLVIETITGSLNVPFAQLPSVSLHTRLNGVQVDYRLPLTFFARYPLPVVDVYQFLHNLRIYADPGSEVRLSASRNGAGSQMSGLVSFSGHYVDLP